MRTQLKILFPDAQTADIVQNKLNIAGIDLNRLFFLSRLETKLGRLKAATWWQSTDSLNQAKRGILIGAGLGLIAGLLALAFPPWYNQAPWYEVLAITVTFGILVGVTGMAFLGMNLLNSDFAAFQDRIAHGQVLMVIQVDTNQVNHVHKAVDAYRV